MRRESSIAGSRVTVCRTFHVEHGAFVTSHRRRAHPATTRAAALKPHTPGASMVSSSKERPDAWKTVAGGCGAAAVRDERRGTKYDRDDLRARRRYAGAARARRHRHRDLAEPAGRPRDGHLGERRLHPDAAAVGNLHDHL